jgi:glutathione S-transferase
VLAVANQLGIELQEVFVDLLAGGNQSKNFLALNPAGMVPVMTHEHEDGSKTVLSEAGAIMIYLCERFKGDDLWPEGGKKYQVLKWMFWAAEHFRQPAPIYFEENVISPMMGKQPRQVRLDAADHMIEKHAPILEAHLETREYVVGESVTLADFDLAAPLSQMSRSNVPYHRFPNIMRWAASWNI